LRGTLALPRLAVGDPAIEVRNRARPLRDWGTELAGRRFLVTGSAGFIGGHLFRRLVDLGLDVIGTVRFPEEADILRERGYRVEVLDLGGDGPWEELLEGVDVVFNLAARFQEVLGDEHEYEAVNNVGAVRLARAAERAGVKRFVQCSTVGVYGDVREIPATEKTPFNPMDLYHRSKLRGERELLEIAARLGPDGMIVTVNRPAMVYGPTDRRMLKLFRLIARRRFAMIGSGEVLAHPGYIEDQTESFLLSAVAPREAVHGEAFNIASDRPVTLDELTRLIARELNAHLPGWRVPLGPVWLAALACEGVCRPLGVRPPLFRRRVGFFMHNRAFDYAKAQRGLGYVSQWTHEEGVRETIAWYREVGWL
jgi:nucleoside-diphosphate-sugar epimerase